MALTRPGKVLATLVVVVILAGGGWLGYKALTGDNPFARGPEAGDLPVPDECPLTGLEADVPNRPALAVKVENAPAARPQAGLDRADIVYEQPTEGGITRFIAVFQCQDASRLGPVRSVRLMDPEAMTQFTAPGSQPLFAHSGGIPEIVKGISDAGLLDVGFEKQPAAYERDVNREQPHNLYTDTADLYAAAGDPTGVPAAMFSYDPRVPTGSRGATTVHVPFPSSTEDIVWRWDEGRGSWLRSTDDQPHSLEGDVQIEAKNLIIQYVSTKPTGFTDVNGVPVLEVATVGQGDAIVFRNGQAIEGQWVRQFPEDVTKFQDGRNRAIELTAGNTWIILLPSQAVATFE